MFTSTDKKYSVSINNFEAEENPIYCIVNESQMNLLIHLAENDIITLTELDWPPMDLS